jgi:transcription termination/antitermination protein NusG
MPILPREIEIAPDTIFDMPASEWPWRVAHVRSRQEKILARHLLRQSIPYYLPTITRPPAEGRRRPPSHAPLFPGYVFYRSPDALLPAVWRSNVIANMIEVPDQGQLQDELSQLRALQLAGASLTPFEELVEGEEVRITEGVFAGYHGIIVRRKGTTRFVVQVRLIRQAVAVEFGREVLRREG